MLTLSILRSEYPANCKRNVPANMPVALDFSVGCHQPAARGRIRRNAEQIHQPGDDGRYGGDETDRDVITAAVAIAAC